MTFIVQDRPNIVEFQNVVASTQALGIEIKKMDATKKQFNAMEYIFNILSKSIDDIKKARKKAGFIDPKL